jgi:hypothetical protein
MALMCNWCWWFDSSGSACDGMQTTTKKLKLNRGRHSAFVEMASSAPCWPQLEMVHCVLLNALHNLILFLKFKLSKEILYKLAMQSSVLIIF